MTDCFFDANCFQSVDSGAPANTTDAHGHSASYDSVLEDEDFFLKMYGGGEGTFAKLQFLGVAGFAFLYAYLYKFKYEDEEKMTQIQLASALSTGTTLFAQATTIRYYSMTVLFGIGFVTQLLDLFGIATMINFYVWGFGLGIFGVFLGFVSNAMLWLQLRKSYTCSQDKTNIFHSGCESLNSIYEYFALWWFVVDSAIWARTASSVHSWIASQWINLPEDYKEERRHNMAEWRDKKDAMLALFSF